MNRFRSENLMCTHYGNRFIESKYILKKEDIAERYSTYVVDNTYEANIDIINDLMSLDQNNPSHFKSVIS